jgi:hypothetical protein
MRTFEKLTRYDAVGGRHMILPGHRGSTRQQRRLCFAARGLRGPVLFGEVLK